jgi:hypothetical protein
MAVKLIDLQLIYGVAGARDKFDDLAAQLVEGEHPGATKVRVKRGDGGVDVRVGEVTDPGGIKVFQCKFFPLGIGDSQKDQIRDSFKECRDSKEFKTKDWTLCLPVDLSQDEAAWFETWRRKQSSSGIQINDVWGATKLEGLLYQVKNRGLLEGFFKQEFLTQIREMHIMLERLIPDFVGRLKQEVADRERAQKADAVARQEEFLAQFVQAARERYSVLLSQANLTRYPTGFWEIIIGPSWIPAHARIKTLNECASIVDTCRVQSGGWRYPDSEGEIRESGQDWVGGVRITKTEVEMWRLSQRGPFVHIFPIWDDVQERGSPPQPWPWTLPPGFTPRTFLELDVAINTFTLIHRFAAQLTARAYDPNDGAVHLAIKLTGTADRILLTGNDLKRMRSCCRATQPELANGWHHRRDELLAKPDELALQAAAWFFERFNWREVSVEGLSRIQRRIIGS